MEYDTPDETRESRWSPEKGHHDVAVTSDSFSPFPEPVMRPAEWPVGTVLGFTKQYSEDGPVYSFAAIRATNARRGWYLSGPRNGLHPLDWDGLLDFIGGPDEWSHVGVAGSWTPMLGF